VFLCLQLPFDMVRRLSEYVQSVPRSSYLLLCEQNDSNDSSTSLTNLSDTLSTFCWAVTGLASTSQVRTAATAKMFPVRQLYLRYSFFCDFTQHWLVVCSIFMGQNVKGEFFFCTAWPLKMGPISCAETSVIKYQTTLYRISEERRSQVHRGGSLKSRLAVFF